MKAEELVKQRGYTPTHWEYANILALVKEAQADAIRTLASGLKKANPQLAQEIVEWWKDATGENLLAALKESKTIHCTCGVGDHAELMRHTMNCPFRMR